MPTLVDSNVILDVFTEVVRKPPHFQTSTLVPMPLCVAMLFLPGMLNVIAPIFLG